MGATSFVNVTGPGEDVWARGGLVKKDAIPTLMTIKPADLIRDFQKVAIMPSC